MRGRGPARDFLGYGANPPQVRWPGNARIAINLNLNVEAGGERSILEGDSQSENLLTDIGFPAYAGKRSPMVESAFEYGPRVGCWRLLRIFRRFDVKASILGVVRGLQMYPELARAFVDEEHEMVSHGWRWIDYHTMNEKEEREHIRLAVKESRTSSANRRSVGSTAVRASTPGACWWSTAAFSTTAIISATSCRSGRASARETIW
jgi:peptidoglycan/xylan/chitin deacetylase (PgdA/CDA1 family)